MTSTPLYLLILATFTLAELPPDNLIVVKNKVLM